MEKLPVLISIPHGGTQIPEELNEFICITEKDLFDDGRTLERLGLDSMTLDEILVYVEKGEKA